MVRHSEIASGRVWSRSPRTQLAACEDIASGAVPAPGNVPRRAVERIAAIVAAQPQAPPPPKPTTKRAKAPAPMACLKHGSRSIQEFEDNAGKRQWFCAVATCSEWGTRKG